MHGTYHEYYKKVFGEIGQCACGTGDCRVTDFRVTELGSPIGYDIVVYRQWMPVGEKVWIPKSEDVPRQLRTERAHVCAYAVGGINIPCAIINAIQI